MGRIDPPVLPGLSQAGRKILQAGYSGEHLHFDSPFLQQGKQVFRAGKQPRVPAVYHTGPLTPGVQKQTQKLLRLGGLPGGHAVGQRQIRQQTPGARHKVGLVQGGQTLNRHRALSAAAGAQQCYSHGSIPSNSAKIVSMRAP